MAGFFVCVTRIHLCPIQSDHEHPLVTGEVSLVHLSGVGHPLRHWRWRSLCTLCLNNLCTISFCLIIRFKVVCDISTTCSMFLSLDRLPCATKGLDFTNLLICPMGSRVRLKPSFWITSKNLGILVYSLEYLTNVVIRNVTTFLLALFLNVGERIIPLGKCKYATLLKFAKLWRYLLYTSPKTGLCM